MSGGTSGSNETAAAELEILRNMESRIRSLEEKCNLIEETEEFQAQGKPLNKDQELLLGSKERTHMQLFLLKHLLHNYQNQGVSAETHSCSIKGMSGLNESGEIFNHNQPDVQQGNNERYLCICDGFSVHCLDLQSDHPFVVDESSSQLPLVDTLEFLEDGLPVTAGLLKYGSDTYIVCGDEFSFGFKEENEIKNTPVQLYKKYGFRSSSRKICRLSLNDKKLSLYPCNNFPSLKKPKFLPIVEVIDREIHVVDTLPRRLVYNFIGPGVIQPSHEVLDVARCDLGWTEIPPMMNCSNHRSKGYEDFIREHLVVGNKMVARCIHSEFVIFDPMKREWVLPTGSDSDSDFRRPRVGDDFRLGNHVCLREFRRTGGDDEILYVVVGVGQGPRSIHDYTTEMLTRVFLVNQNGEIRVCQTLPSFFNGGDKEECYLVDYATLFKVDERTVCIVAIGFTHRGFVREESLHIWTITVDQLDASLPQNNGQNNGEEEEFVFVKVDVKKSRFYEIGSQLWSKRSDEFEPFPPRFSACFL